ncbi:XRE family transcriptional regulator [bacterium D16-54]|nr:XRE family transcriptional regulator [bacterium D16-54]RKJ15645.1 XRE family transcriptional regulator [bacterium D16-56]
MEKEHTFSKGDVEIGQRIRRLRKYLRMTQKELAEKVMISPSSITRLESGQIMVSLFTLIEIAKVLQVPVSTILAENHKSGIEAELSQVTLKLAKCTPEQRKALIQCFELMVDAIFFEK